MNSVAKGSENKQSLSDQLREKFRLKAEPFGEATQLFYQGAQRQHNLETLRHLVNFGDMLLLLTGDSGSGKTTLIAELSKQVATDVRVLSLKPSLISTPRKLVEELCKKLELRQIDGEPAERAMDRIVQRCQHDSQTGKRTLIVVDDAEKASKDSFQFLVSTFKQLGNDAGVCLLMSGQPSVLQYLTSDGVEPSRCGWMHQLQLKPFSQEDAETYVSLRLIRAGAVSEPELSASQRSALHELGKGCPGRINRIAPGVLLDVFSAATTEKEPPKSLSWLLVGIAAALILSFLVIGYQYKIIPGSLESTAMDEPASTSLDILDGENSLPASEMVTLSKSSKVGDSLGDKSYGDGESRNVLDDVSLGMAQSETAAERNVEFRSGGLEVSSDVAVSSELEQPRRLINDSREGQVAPKLEPKTEPVSDDVSQKMSEVEEITRTPKTEAVSKPVVPENASSVASKNQHSRFRSASWLNEQPQEAYTIQLLGSRSESTAVKYVDKADASIELFYLASTYKGKPWFVVIAGVFPGKEAARAGLSKLPASMQKQQPWIRSIKGLRDN